MFEVVFSDVVRQPGLYHPREHGDEEVSAIGSSQRPEIDMLSPEFELYLQLT